MHLQKNISLFLNVLYLKMRAWSAVAQLDRFLYLGSRDCKTSHSYQLDQSISVLRCVVWYFLIFIHILPENSLSKQWRH